MLDLFKPYLASMPIPAFSGTTIFALVLVVLTAIIFSSLSAATSTITIHKKLIGHHLGHGLEEDALDVSDFEPEDLDDEGRPHPPASARTPSVVRITSSDPSSPLCLDPIRIIDDGSGMSGNRIILPPPAPVPAPNPALLSPIIPPGGGGGSTSSSIAGSDTSSLTGSDSARRKKHLAKRRFSVESSSSSLVKRNSVAKKRPDNLRRRVSKGSPNGSTSPGLGLGDASAGVLQRRRGSGSASPSAEPAAEAGSLSPLDPFLSPASSDGTWHDADEDSDDERAFVDLSIGAGILNTSAGTTIEEEEPSSPTMMETPELPVTDAASSVAGPTSPSSSSSAPSTPSPDKRAMSPNARARRAAIAVQAWHDSPPPVKSGASGKKNTRLPPNAPLPATPTPTASAVGHIKGKMRDYYSSSDTESVLRFGAPTNKRSTPPSILRRQPQPFRSALLPLPSKGRALKAARFLVFPPELEQQWQAQVQRAQIQQAMLSRQHLQQQQQLLSGPTPTTHQIVHQPVSSAPSVNSPNLSADPSVASDNSDGGRSSVEGAPPTPPAKDDVTPSFGRHVRPPPPAPISIPPHPTSSTPTLNSAPWSPAGPWVDTPTNSGTVTPLTTFSTSQPAGGIRPVSGGMRRKRTIRMREPDWAQFAPSHARAREREEMRARALIARRASISSAASSAPTSSVSSARAGGSPSRRRKGKSISSLLGGVLASSDGGTRGEGGGEETEEGDDEMEWEEEEGDVSNEGNSSGVSIPIVRVEDDDSMDAFEDDEEFWFERFTRSTAAAGKDWDWRKRRARVLIPSPPPQPSQTAGEADASAGGKGAQSDGPLPALPPNVSKGSTTPRPSNVGRDAVDIIHEDRALLNVPSQSGGSAGGTGSTVVSDNGGLVTKRLISPRASPRKASLPLAAEEREKAVGLTSNGNEATGSVGDIAVPLLLFKTDDGKAPTPAGAGEGGSSSVVRFPQGSPEATRSGGRSASSGDSPRGSPSSSPKSTRRSALASLTRGDHGSASGATPPSPTSGRIGLRAKVAMRLSAWTSGDAPVLPADGSDDDKMSSLPQEDRHRRLSTDSDLGQKRDLTDAHLASSEVFKIARRRTSSEGRVLHLGGNEEKDDGNEEIMASSAAEGGMFSRREWRKKSDASVPARLSSLTSSKDRPRRDSGSGGYFSNSLSSRSQRRKRHTSFGSLLQDDERVQRLLAEAEKLSSDDDSMSGKVEGSRLLSASSVHSTPSIVLNGHHRDESKITLFSNSPSTASSASAKLSPKSATGRTPNVHGGDPPTAQTAAAQSVSLSATTTTDHHPPALDVFRAPAGLPQASPRTTSMPKVSSGKPGSDAKQTPTTVRSSKIPQSHRTSETSSLTPVDPLAIGNSSSSIGTAISRKESGSSLSARRRILSDTKNAQILAGSSHSGSGTRPSPSVPVLSQINVGGSSSSSGGGGKGGGSLTPERYGFSGSPSGPSRSSSPSPTFSPSYSPDLGSISGRAPSAWADLSSRLPRRTSTGSLSSNASSNKSSPGAPGSASFIPVPVSPSQSSSPSFSRSAVSYLPYLSSSTSSTSSLSMNPSSTSDGTMNNQGMGGSGTRPSSRQSSPALGTSTTAAAREREYRRSSTGLVQSELVRHFSRTDPQSMIPRANGRA
ncbi:hypothetical protein CF326_g3607 [Tilletia indica]|nr:hypothetical protein CF326_g3607 [Tilletia indica]